MNSNVRTTMMLTVGFVIGALFIFQSKSLNQANLSYSRENSVSIFKEIQIVKESNEDLSEQKQQLQREVEMSNDREKSLENIKKEINNYQMLTGEVEVSGPGLVVEIEGELEALWFTDLVNELFSADAEAISINNIRYNPENLGFDTMPNGQILFGGEILTPPFKFVAIGDPDTMEGLLIQKGGIIERLRLNKPDQGLSLIKDNNLLIPAMKAE